MPVARQPATPPPDPVPPADVATMVGMGLIPPDPVASTTPPPDSIGTPLTAPTT